MERHHAIYVPETGAVYHVELTELGTVVIPWRYITTIEKNLTVEQALAKIVQMGPEEFFGIKTEDLEEDNPEAPWERDPEWWKE
jgi:hypothetical protein